MKRKLNDLDEFQYKPRMDKNDEISWASGLDEYQRAAYEAIIVERRNVFITGAGGCGKTYLIKKLVEYYSTPSFGVRKLAVLSTTGVTALMIDGRTFASFFGFGIMDESREYMWKMVKGRRYLRTRMREIDVLVIDEISMLSATQFESASYVCQMFRNDQEKPFGGIQIVLCGDFSQLPPVKGAFVFRSAVWNELGLRYCELLGNHRQRDDYAFHLLLNKVRRGNIDTYVRNVLKERVGATFKEGVRPTELCSRRDYAERCNLVHLNQLEPGTERTYHAQIEWRNRGTLSDKAAETREKMVRKSSVTPDELRLRTGALVMLTYNMDLGRGLANGSLGEVVRFERDSSDVEHPVVKFFDLKDDEELVVKEKSWARRDVLDKSVLNYTQVPLILAWAITIHKSQGATLNYVKIKLDKTLFTDGQAYVALSRCRTLEGITLDAFQAASIKTNNLVVDFYDEHALLRAKDDE